MPDERRLELEGLAIGRVEGRDLGDTLGRVLGLVLGLVVGRVAGLLRELMLGRVAGLVVGRVLEFTVGRVVGRVREFTEGRVLELTAGRPLLIVELRLLLRTLFANAPRLLNVFRFELTALRLEALNAKALPP